MTTGIVAVSSTTSSLLSIRRSLLSFFFPLDAASGANADALVKFGTFLASFEDLSHVCFAYSLSAAGFLTMIPPAIARVGAAGAGMEQVTRALRG